MKRNTTILITLSFLLLAGILGWGIFGEKLVFKESLKNANTKVAPPNPSVSLRILFPSYGQVVPKGPLAVTYQMIGGKRESDRVDLILLESRGRMERRTGTIQTEEGFGSELFSSLEKGEYRLLARVVRGNGSPVLGQATESLVVFRVEESTKGSGG